jgi:hypothetical protein
MIKNKKVSGKKGIIKKLKEKDYIKKILRVS